MKSLFQGKALLLLLLMPVTLMAAEPAGFVLMASGKVFAVQSNQEVRALKRRSPFYPGETLRTEAKAKAQVRFRDGSLISLRPKTEIRIDEFRFNEEQLGEDKNIFTLINGGFRTITGKIGKKNPDNYQMKSSVASIGVRGTTYEVVLDNGLNVAAWQGSIDVKNDSGTITLGAEGVFNFAHVATSVSRPVGRMRPPASIANEQEVFADEGQREDDAAQEMEEEGAAEETAETAESQQDTDEGTLAQSMENDADSEPNTKTSVQVFVDDDKAEKPPISRRAEPGPVRPVAPNDAPNFAPPTETPPVAGPLPPLPPIVTQPVPPDIFDPAPDNLPDPRVADVNLSRLGIYQVIDNMSGFNYSFAKAGPNGNSELHFADNGFKPDQSQFIDAPFVSVLSRGAAPELNLFSDGVYPVTWGIWDGVAQPVELALDSADAQSFTPINQPVHWLTVDATAVAAVNARTGYAEYRNVIAFDGIGSDGNLMDLFMNLGVDFDSGSVVGDMHLYSANDVWDINLSGNVSAPLLAITSVTGQLNGSSPVSGRVNTLFSGANAQALAGMASFEVAGNPSIFLDSMFLLDDAPVGDLRLTPAEVSSLNRIGLAMESNPVPGVHYLGGKASAGMSPIFADNGYMPGDPLFTTAPILDVLRQGDAQSVSFFDDPKYPVSWGIWDAPGNAIAQLDADDPMLVEVLLDPIVWMTLQPTADNVLAARTGAAYYHSAPMTPATQGLSNAGQAITGLNADLEVNFDLALFKGKLSFFTDPSDSWDVGFDGFLDGPRLAVTGMNGSYSGAGGTGGANGSLFMLLTGNQPNAIAGGFDLEFDADSNYFVQGNFIAERDLRLSFADAAAMDRVALTALSSPGMMDTFVGRSTSGSSGNPVIGRNSYYDPEMPGFWIEELYSVFRKGGAPDLVAPVSNLTYQMGAPDAAFEVSWGAWNGQATAFDEQTDPIDASVKLPMNHDMYWITLLPSPVDQITGTAAGRTGILMYANPIDILGGGTDGAIDASTFTFSANLDFDTGNVTSGMMDFDDIAANNWNASFTGTLNGASLQIISPMVQYNYDSVTPTVGEINAVLTGPNAEGIGGSFDFDYSSGTKSVEGVFLVNCVGDPSC